MKHLPWLFFAAAYFFIQACSTLPEPEKEPFSQWVEKAIDAPTGDGIIDRAIDNAATTFPQTKKTPAPSGTPPPPRSF